MHGRGAKKGFAKQVRKLIKVTVERCSGSKRTYIVLRCILLWTACRRIVLIREIVGDHFVMTAFCQCGLMLKSDQLVLEILLAIALISYIA